MDARARHRPPAGAGGGFGPLHAARRPAVRGRGRRGLADGAEKSPAFVDALVPVRGDLGMIWAAQAYPVWVGAGAVDAAGELLADRGALLRGGR